MRSFAASSLERVLGPGARLARHPRFRAATRREVRSASLAAGVTLVAVLIIDGLFLGEPAPGQLMPNVVGCLLMLMVIALLRGPLRRRPEVAAFAIGTIGVGAALQPMSEVADVRYLMLAYFSLLAVAVALFIPWDSRWHGSWLLVAFLALCGVVLSPVGAGMEEAFRADAIMGASRPSSPAWLATPCSDARGCGRSPRRRSCAASTSGRAASRRSCHA